MQTRYELAVFDIAGTTVFDGDAVNLCLRRALDGVAGCAVSRAAVNRVMGIPKPLAIARLLEEAGTVAPEERVSEVLANFEHRMLDYYQSDPAVREMDGASSVFAELQARGIQVALDTGFSRKIVDCIVRRLEWDRPGVLDATIASDEVPAGRPAPDMVYRLMQKCGVPATSSVIKIGDTPADLLEGAAAGCGMIVGVCNGSHTADELKAFPHTILIPGIRQLPSVLFAT